MKTCAAVLLLAVAAFAEFHAEDAAFGMEFRSGEAEPSVDFIEEHVPETMLTAVETLRRAAPSRLSHHVRAISQHAQLLQTADEASKESAYKHDFAASKAAIKAALQSLAKELAAGHKHDKNALTTSKATGESAVQKADAKGLSSGRALRHKVCPSQRAEEAAFSKKTAAEAKLKTHESVRVCGTLSTTWDDMNVQKTDMKYGTALHNAWAAARRTWTKYKGEMDAAIRAHTAAKAFNVKTMTEFKTTVSIEAGNTHNQCQAAHKEYEALKREVASNVNTRKQTFIATLVITCYVDNMTDNKAAKVCADKKRGASTSQWNITPGTMAACASKTANENKYGPLDWSPTKLNCRGGKGKESESTGRSTQLVGDKSIQLVTNGKIATISTTSEYEVEFDIYPTSKKSGWHNIMSFVGSGQTHHRIPAMWFFSNSYRLHMRAGTNKSWNDGCDPSKHLPGNQWTTVKFQVTKSAITSYFDGVQVCKDNGPFTLPSAQSNVKAYISHGHAAGAKVRNLVYTKLN